jgi:hypothetical protein
MFPINFDYDLYKKYNDLQLFNNNQLLDHYNINGKNEGRVCSLGQNRDFLNSVPKKFLNCLEIGPFDVPVLKGENVYYFDVLNKEDLIKRAISINRINNLNNIPFIKYVNSIGDLTIIEDKFDVILSCHSIEHQIDFIKHINDVENLLNNNGYYIVILPDKRYCFDHFIKESTIADIIDAHNTKNNFHKLKSVIEHRALTCHNNSIDHWNGIHGTQNINNIDNAIKEYNEYLNKNEYLDVHAWQFTPESFSNIINILNNLKYTNFKLSNLYNTVNGSCEFIVILQKS